MMKIKSKHVLALVIPELSTDFVLQSHICSSRQPSCVHRAYQNLLTSTNGSEYESVLQLEPALLGGIISTLTTALAPVRLS